MAKRCEICGKGQQVGYTLSHAHNRNKHVWYPNLQKVRVGVRGARRRMRVCTQCIRSGRLEKVS